MSVVAGGKEVLVVRGQQVGVMQLEDLIKNKLHAHASQAQKEEGRERGGRPRGGLPSAADRMKIPAYWTVSACTMNNEQ